MSSNYTGNPTASRSPAAAPDEGVAPILALPGDSDPASAASIAQAHEVAADYIAWLTLHAALKKYGISVWSSTESPSYVVGTVVRDPTDGLIYYLTTLAGINNALQPHQQASNWARFGFNSRANPAASLGAYATGIAAVTDVKGNLRWGLDHQGFPAGQIGGWNEMWDLPAVTSSGRFGTVLNSGTFATGAADSSPGLGSPFFAHVGATPDRTNVLPTYAHQLVPNFSVNNDTAVVVECPLAFGAVGVNSIMGWFGIGNADPQTAGRGVFVFRTSGGNWSFFSPEITGIGGATDTGIAPVVNTYDSLKIVLLGINASDSGVARAHLIINGVAVASIDNPISPGPAIGISFGASQIVTAAAPVTCAFGPMRYIQGLSRGNFF